MITVYKYEVLPMTVIKTHSGAKFLSSQMQSGKLVCWLEVDTKNHEEDFCVCCYGTGHEIHAENRQYLSTVKIEENLVFHLYRVYP